MALCLWTYILDIGRERDLRLLKLRMVHCFLLFDDDTIKRHSFPHLDSKSNEGGESFVNLFSSKSERIHAIISETVHLYERIDNFECIV